MPIDRPSTPASLPAAKRDIAAIASVLNDPNLGHFDQVNDLLDPDLGQLQDAIVTLFDDCQSDDLVLLYFSGHGITDESGHFFFTNRTTRKTPQGRLNKGSATPASFVHDLMENCNSDRQVIVLDCCHSGAFPTGMTARDAGTIDFQRQLGGKGRIVLTSSAATEYSFERQGEELAIYTRYWVEGIKTGAADLDGDGAISVNELHDYVREQVRKAAPAMKPERYVFQDGEKILLAKAPIGDPKQEFRKLVQIYSQEGIIRPAGKSVLERRRQALGLTPEVATAIVSEMLRPYQEHRENLREYERVLREEVAFEFPLSDLSLQELTALQRELNLTNANVAAISSPILEQQQREWEQSRQREQQQPAQTAQSQAPAQVSPTPAPPQIQTQQFEFATATLSVVQKSGLFGRKTEIQIQRSRGRAEYFAANLGNGITLEMVAIPGGRFRMGTSEAERNTVIQEYTRYGSSQSDAEKWVSWETPQHEVTIQPVFLGKYPVTQAQYEAIMGTNPSNFKGANRPVENVSWDEAGEFCDRLSQTTGKAYRLPSEAEWEYACRAGTTTPFYFGDTINPDLVNYDGNYPYGRAAKRTYRQETTEVGSFPANGFGLFDMHGNVWEWCADPWHDSYNRAPSDGRVWELESDRENNLRLLRGGSWCGLARYCRSAYRGGGGRGNCLNDVGFRVFCSLPKTL